MRVSVLDASIPLSKQQSQGMACIWLKHELRSNKIDVSNIDDSDIIFISCVAPEQYKFVSKIKHMYKNKRVYVGGSASSTPTILSEHCDGVCIGDGQEFIRVLASGGIDTVDSLDNVLTKEKKSVTIDQNFPYLAPPIQCEDGAYRLYCGRGCKNKCLFCQTGWAYTYSEHPQPDILIHQATALIKQGKRINYLSNDTTQHSFFKRLPVVEHGSFSFKYIQKYGLPKARQIRLGVEGVSERLRKFVKKPISKDDLVGCTAWLNANGRGVRWFMIAGLPTETHDDWLELRESIQQWKVLTKKGVLAVSFTAWRPSPATPLAPMPITDQYHDEFLQFKEWFFAGKGWSNRVKIMFPQDPQNRVKSALAEMNITEDQLRRGGEWGPNDIVYYPYKRQRDKIYLDATQNEI